MVELPTPKPWRERLGSDPLAGPEPVEPELEPPLPLPTVPFLGLLVVDLGERLATCERHGEYRSTGKSIGVTRKHEHWSGCQACRREGEEMARQSELRLAQEQRRLRLEQLVQRTAVPERFLGRRFDAYEAETEPQRRALAIATEYALDFPRHARSGASLVFSGSPGTGKSHLACAVLQAILPEHVGLYTTVMGLIRMVRDTWGKDAARSESQVLAELAALDLLVVDEVGVQYGTDAERTLIFEILDRRYLDKRPVILLTNLGATAFRQAVGDRVMDRLSETARWIPCSWPSYRPKAARAADDGDHP